MTKIIKSYSELNRIQKNYSGYNEAIKKYLNGGVEGVVGTVIGIQARKPYKDSYFFFFNQINGLITHCKVLKDTRITKALLNAFILDVVNNIHGYDHIVEGHKPIIYIPKGIISSNKTVSDLTQIYQIDIKPFNWKDTNIPRSVIDLHLLLSSKTLMLDLPTQIKNFNRLVESRILSLSGRKKEELEWEKKNSDKLAELKKNEERQKLAKIEADKLKAEEAKLKAQKADEDFVLNALRESV